MKKAPKAISVERLRANPLRFVCSWHGNTSGYFPMHFHRVIEMVYHPRGSGVTLMGDGRKIEFEPHGVVIYPAGLKHDQRMYTPGVDICVHIAASSAQPLFAEALYIPAGGAGSNRADRYVRTEFLNLAHSRPNRDRQVELDLRVTALVSRLLQLNRSIAEEIPKTPSEFYIDRARQFISDHYLRISSMREIAEHVGVSEDYLRHLFLAEGGTSLSQLVIQTKIERVKELLIHSKLPIKEISTLTGFKTERYLSTRFKKQTGVTPGDFRMRSMEQPEVIVNHLSR